MAETTGGSFLIQDQEAATVFTPEDFTPEQESIRAAVRSFFDGEVAPASEAIAGGDHACAIRLLKQAAALGFESILTPEEYGGMELDLTSAMIVAEELARDASFAAWHGAHAGIGTMPLLWFGTDAQKAKYLPRLSSCEMVAAYCLTEPQAGSDALAAKTRADLTADGRHYVLNGQKMWITNGGRADLFTVFAKVNGEQFSAFLVERAWPGVATGNEEKKMGISGSSTTAVFFDNVLVPVENLLGEPGRGHIIAFNILNLGRLKLGAFAAGGSKEILRVSLAWAKQRKAFGTEIAQFGVIRHKLAEMAIRIYATESMTCRVEGLIAAAAGTMPLMKAVEEFAAECSIVKVYGSEALDYVADEGVQIHGGYGYHRDYAVERAYRDSRINRIFEGTNEINRLLTTGMLLRRAQQGRLALAKAAKELMNDAMNGPRPGLDPVSNAKNMCLLLLAAAFSKFGAALEKEQEVMAGIADAVIETFAMESALLRARKSRIAAQMCEVFASDAITRIETFARPVLAACAQGDALRTHLALLRRFAKHEPANSIELRRAIAGRLLEAGRYVV